MSCVQSLTSIACEPAIEYTHVAALLCSLQKYIVCSLISNTISLSLRFVLDIFCLTLDKEQYNTVACQINKYQHIFFTLLSCLD